MENEKYYRKKRLKIKDKKQDVKDVHFESSKERKAFIQSLKKEYRALKRSEKQDVQKFINEQINNQDENLS